MGLALIAFAAWLTIDRRRLGLRLALFNAVSIVLFFCHLAAFAALALLIALNEAPPRRGESRRDWAARLLAAPCCLLAGFALWAFAPPIDSRLSGPGSKLAALAAPMYDQTAAGGRRRDAGAGRHRRRRRSDAARRLRAGDAGAARRRRGGRRPRALGARRGRFHRRAAGGSARLSRVGLAAGAERRRRQGLDRRPGGRAGRGAGRPGGAALGAIRRLGGRISRGDPRRAAGRARARRRAAARTLPRRSTPRTSTAGWSISSSSTAARWRAPCSPAAACSRSRPSIRVSTRRRGRRPIPIWLDQPRLARALRHADRPARRLRLAAGRIRARSPVAETPQATIYRLR